MFTTPGKEFCHADAVLEGILRDVFFASLAAKAHRISRERVLLGFLLMIGDFATLSSFTGNTFFLFCNVPLHYYLFKRKNNSCIWLFGVFRSLDFSQELHTSLRLYLELIFKVNPYRWRVHGSPGLWSHRSYPGHWQWWHFTSLHHLQGIGFGPGLLEYTKCLSSVATWFSSLLEMDLFSFYQCVRISVWTSKEYPW